MSTANLVETGLKIIWQTVSTEFLTKDWRMFSTISLVHLGVYHTFYALILSLTCSRVPSVSHIFTIATQIQPQEHVAFKQ